MADSREWTVDLDAAACGELLHSINKGQMFPGGMRLGKKATIARIGNLKIQVFSDEHPPPHFRVEFGGETANYTIRDCAQLNGGLAQWKHNVIAWHKKNKSLLIQKWNSSRPTGCPVGPYVE